jgi:hypothetical protein
VREHTAEAEHAGHSKCIQNIDCRNEETDRLGDMDVGAMLFKSVLEKQLHESTDWIQLVHDSVEFVLLT